jgi:zinc transport system substrate-binding protein
LISKRLRFVSILLFAFLLDAHLPSGICSASQKSGAEKPAALKVLTSFYPVTIMALNVTRDVPGVAVTSLVSQATGCLHDYALTSADMKKIAGARLLITNGLGMESFLDRVAAQSPSLQVVRLSEGIRSLTDPHTGQANPHLWVSLSGAMAQVKNLGAAMEAADPSHAAQYRKNTGEYLARLETLREKFLAALRPYKGTKIITLHEAFPYFAEEFGFVVAGVIQREPGSAPSAKELAETIDLVKNSGVREIWIEPQYPAGSAETIARETGARILVLDPAVTGPEDPDAYLRIMEKNLETLKTVLETP